MAFNYQFPRIGNVDTALHLDTPVTADTAIEAGTITVKNEAGADALVIRACDLISFINDDYAAGTAHAVDVTLTGATLANSLIYSVTVFAPNVINFFGGGRETGAVYQTRTYNVSSPATGSFTADALKDLFIAAINADPGAYFSAASGGVGVLEITADSAEAGALEITAPAGATIADATAFVAPVGKVSELVAYGLNPASLGGTAYHRIIIQHRKLIRSNAVSGLQVFAPVNSIVFIQDTGAGDTAQALLEDILDGSYASSIANAAKYLGCPEL